MTELPGPSLLSLALEPKTQADQERLARGLGALIAEDPTINVKADPRTGTVVIAGRGELHLEIILHRLAREFNVEASVGTPQIAYKETLTVAAEGDGRFVRQTGGRGQYARAKIRLTPLPLGAGYEFANEIVGGAVPHGFIEPIDQGIQEALTRGVLAGYPVDDLRIELYDGSYHEVDSSAMAFKVAGFMAFQDAAKKGNPVLLEPLMHVEVVVPTRNTSEVISDLSSRRGQIQLQQEGDGVDTIHARVPLSEMLGYVSDLSSRTHGRGRFTLQFATYQPFVPPGNWPDGDGSLVGAPRKPTPTLRVSSVAVPEPNGNEC
jgi:elongation factor G